MDQIVAVDKSQSLGGNARDLSAGSTGSESIEISYYDNEVPSFVDMELGRLYQNIYSSLAKFKIDGPMDSVNTYVSRKGSEIVTLLLFRYEKEEVKVLNEMIRMDSQEIDRFVRFIFNKFGSVAVISLSCIQTELRGIKFPYQKFYCSEDIVVTLPGSASDYRARLGKNLRKTINQYTNKLERSYPSFCFKIAVMEEIQQQQLIDILQLHKARMRHKNKTLNTTDEEIEKIIGLAKVCGLVGVAIIDGRVCAGQICWRAGEHFFARTIAHDPKFDQYRLGTLCCYLTICECIARGGKEFHFLWGRHEYKSSFLGIERDFDRVVIYRSRVQLFLNSKMALNVAFTGIILEIQLWLQNAERQDKLIHRTAVRFVYLVRKLKRLFAGAMKIPATDG